MNTHDQLFDMAIWKEDLLDDVEAFDPTHVFYVLTPFDILTEEDSFFPKHLNHHEREVLRYLSRFVILMVDKYGDTLVYSLFFHYDNIESQYDYETRLNLKELELRALRSITTINPSEIISTQQAKNKLEVIKTTILNPLNHYNPDAWSFISDIQGVMDDLNVNPEDSCDPQQFLTYLDLHRDIYPTLSCNNLEDDHNNQNLVRSIGHHVLYSKPGSKEEKEALLFRSVVNLHTTLVQKGTAFERFLRGLVYFDKMDKVSLHGSVILDMIKNALLSDSTDDQLRSWEGKFFHLAKEVAPLAVVGRTSHALMLSEDQWETDVVKRLQALKEKGVDIGPYDGYKHGMIALHRVVSGGMVRLLLMKNPKPNGNTALLTNIYVEPEPLADSVVSGDGPIDVTVTFNFKESFDL